MRNNSKTSLKQTKRARVRRAVARRFSNADAVLTALRQRHASGRSLSPMLVQKEDEILAAAVHSRCRSWRQALMDAGLDPDEHLGKKARVKDPAVVIAWIQERRAAGLGLRQLEVEGPFSLLFRAAVRMFETWGLALEAAGVDPRPHVRSRKKHRPEAEVRAMLQRMLVDGGGRLTRSRVQSDKDWTLYSDARHWAARHAKRPTGRAASWSDVLTWIGASGDYHTARDQRRTAGQKFEVLAQTVWPAVDPDTLQHPRFNPPVGSQKKYVEPDRARGTELFIEFRLAASPMAVASAVERYRGLCDRLMIVVLEGLLSHDVPEWVEVRSIFDFEHAILQGGFHRELKTLRALSRGERPYVPERCSREELIAKLRAIPVELHGDVTAMRQYFYRKHGQSATKRLDKLRGTFAASCFAEGLASEPGPNKRPHVPRKYWPAVLHHFIRTRRAMGLPVQDPSLFYAGKGTMRRMYDYAFLTYGGWSEMLKAMANRSEAPTLPSAYHIGIAHAAFAGHATGNQ